MVRRSSDLDPSGEIREAERAGEFKLPGVERNHVGIDGRRRKRLRRAQTAAHRGAAAGLSRQRVRARASTGTARLRLDNLLFAAIATARNIGRLGRLDRGRAWTDEGATHAGVVQDHQNGAEYPSHAESVSAPEPIVNAWAYHHRAAASELTTRPQGGKIGTCSVRGLFADLAGTGPVTRAAPSGRRLSSSACMRSRGQVGSCRTIG